MSENLDLTKILRNCPIGTKFYSSYLGKDVFFIGIYDNCIKCEYTSQIDSLNSIIQFKKDSSLYPGGECMLFPSKDQRDWTKWQRPFKDGDIIHVRYEYSDATFTYVAILKQIEKGEHIYSHCFYNYEDNVFSTHDYLYEGYNVRFATEEEKQKLFDVIKDKGYRWNDENKTLEKLIEPKFKVGDIISSKNGLQTHKITNATPEYYSVEVQDKDCIGVLPVKYQDNWELVPNKFDITTLNHLIIANILLIMEKLGVMLDFGTLKILLT